NRCATEVHRAAGTCGHSTRFGSLRSIQAARGAPMTSAIAVLVFLFVVVLVVGGWWVSQMNRSLRSRLSRPAPVGSTQVLKPDIEGGDGAIEQFLARTGQLDRLVSLAAQAGYTTAVSDLTMIVVACAAVGGAGGWLRTGGFLWGILTGLISGSVP